MATVPQISQGTLNRIRATVSPVDYPALTVTPPYLSKRMITLTPNGDITTFINAATGVVQSPEPYFVVSVKMYILKSNGLAETYKQQFLTQSYLGQVNIKTDTSALSDFTLQDAAIMHLDELDFSGESAEFAITIAGTVYLNSDLWNIS